MAIKNGNLPDADDVLELSGQLFKNQANLIWNSDLIGFNSKLNYTGIPNLNKTFYNTFSSDIATKSKMVYSPTYYSYFTLNDAADYLVGEDFSGTGDPAGWTEATSGSGSYSATQTGGYYELTTSSTTQYSTPTIICTNTGITNCFTSYSEGLKIKISPTSYALGGAQDGYTALGNATIKVRLTDGSTPIELYSQTLNINTQTLYFTEKELSLIKIGNYLYVYTGSDFTRYDISSYSTCEIQFYATSTLSSANGQSRHVDCVLDIDWIKYDSFSTDCYIITPSSTAIETVTNAIMVSNQQLGTDAVCSLSISADGTNFVNAIDSKICDFVNTGTSLKRKINITGGTGMVNQEAVIYNVRQ